MENCIINLRGTLKDPNDFTNRLTDFKTFFGLQEGGNLVHVKNAGRVTFRIPHKVDQKIRSVTGNKTDLVNVGVINLPINLALNGFLVAKENAYGAGYLVGQEAKKILQTTLMGAAAGKLGAEAVDVGRKVIKKPGLSDTQKQIPALIIAALLGVLTYVNEERNKERVKVGLPPI